MCGCVGVLGGNDPTSSWETEWLVSANLTSIFGGPAIIFLSRFGTPMARSTTISSPPTLRSTKV